MEVSQEQVSRDGTRKRLWRLHDGRLIESVLMPYDTNRRTACISSQVGHPPPPVSPNVPHPVAIPPRSNKAKADA
eukprot:6601702-Prymnesium_polylepis.1